MTEHEIEIPGDLAAKVQARAEERGETFDETVLRAVRQLLADED